MRRIVEINLLFGVAAALWEWSKSTSDIWILCQFRPAGRFRSESRPPWGWSKGNWRQHAYTSPSSCAWKRQFTQKQVLEMRRRWVVGGKAGRDKPGFFRSPQADGCHTRFAFAQSNWGIPAHRWKRPCASVQPTDSSAADIRVSFASLRLQDEEPDCGQGNRSALENHLPRLPEQSATSRRPKVPARPGSEPD